jgi:Na+:H+ antiporter
MHSANCAAMRRTRPLILLLAVPLLLAATDADPSAKVVLAMAVIYVVAVLCGEVAVRMRQPAVLGELVGGMIIGNLHLIGIPWLAFMKTDPGIALLARLGVLILLFEVGLEATVAEMLRVGVSSLLVATLGVVTPFALGWMVGAWLLPGHSAYVHAFLGATLTATSVGITARVLKDLDRSRTEEARIILGAAVIDDVMGLVVLAVVTGLITAAGTGTPPGFGGIAVVLLKAVGFLAVAVALGQWLAPRMMRAAARLQTRNAALIASLALCFVTAWGAYAIGLAPIVGAFAAGLVLEASHYEQFTARGEHSINELLAPIGATLVPIFFVLMGMRTDLSAFLRLDVVGLALALTIAAIVGKQACALGVRRGLNGLAVGLGMIPRGEVGLIFANIGLGLAVAGERIVNEATYSAVVVMVIVTTLITPPLLKWGFVRGGSGPQPARGRDST